MKKPLLSFFQATSGLLLGSILFEACSLQDHLIPSIYPAFAEASNPKTLSVAKNGTVLYNGGYGSALANDPNDPNIFYLLTDRGPNAAGVTPNSIVFGKTDFTPQIGKFRLVNGELVLVETILLKTAGGTPLTGLPNPVGEGNTGETALDLDGNPLGTSADGIDSEGLVRLSDGSFWVSDEYGPHIAHFDKTGKTLERINPFGTGTGGRKIPLVFAKRRPNRGMEGLTITPDGKTLVGLMQSPMFNPSNVSGSLVLRVLTFDIATGVTRQYVYLMENASLTGCSEIAAITNTTFLALERDGNYGGHPTTPATFKRIYKFDIADATDISDPDNKASGKLYGGQTVEQLKDLTGLQGAGIVPVKKTLVFDLLTEISPVYPHDKAEGIAIISSNQIAISNDDDFGVVDNGANSFMTKLLPATGQVDKNRIYFVTTKEPFK